MIKNKTQQMKEESIRDQLLACIAIAQQNIAEGKENRGAFSKRYAKSLKKLKNNKDVMNLIHTVRENKHLPPKTVQKISELINVNITVWQLTPKFGLEAITNSTNLNMARNMKVVHVYESRIGYALVSRIAPFLQFFKCQKS